MNINNNIHGYRIMTGKIIDGVRTTSVVSSNGLIETLVTQHKRKTEQAFDALTTQPTPAVLPVVQVETNLPDFMQRYFASKTRHVTPAPRGKGTFFDVQG